MRAVSADRSLLLEAGRRMPDLLLAWTLIGIWYAPIYVNCCVHILPLLLLLVRRAQAAAA